ncbi:pilin [Vreelandella massiliensis]|uniref:pilin n=1 Tax=Vreelandella massiliensis TaxID=1816686 RepID=UPI00096A40FE|nr:pilin [Halomonas massiliensis]
MNGTQRGFTLIELMIVVAIIGVLASIAVPQYQNYTARSQVSEAFSLAAAYKTALTEYYAIHGRFPQSNEEAGLPTDHAAVHGGNASQGFGGYVEAIGISPATGNYNARFVIEMSETANSEIAGGWIVMEAYESSGSIKFSCRTTTGAGEARIPPKYMPSSCYDEKE